MIGLLHIGGALPGADRHLRGAFTARAPPLGGAFDLRAELLGGSGEPDVTARPAWTIFAQVDPVLFMLADGRRPPHCADVVRLPDRPRGLDLG